MPVDLSIIIVNWKSKDYVRKCLETVYSQTKNLVFEVIVVDSASFDGCGDMLATHFPEARFIQSQENVGFAKSNNIGFEQSRAEALLFLNPDTELRGPAINILFNSLNELPNCGAVGARLLNTDGTLQTSCVQSFPTILNQALDSELLRSKTPTSVLWGTAALLDLNTRASVEVLSGACIMIKRHVFEQAGRFPEAYFMYSEDLELCYRVRQLGLENYYVPQARIIHHGGGSSQQSRSEFSNVMMRESVSRFLARTRGGLYSRCYRLSVSISAALRLGIIALVFPINALRGKRAALSAAARKWTAILRWSVGMQDWVSKYR